MVGGKQGKIGEALFMSCYSFILFNEISIAQRIVVDNWITFLIFISTIKELSLRN